MRKQVNCIALAALAAGLLLLPALSGQNKSEQYSGVLQMTGGAAGGASRSIDIWINKYNTDEDIKGYATLLVEGGPDKLRRALEKEDVGQIAPVGRTGIALAVARKFVNGNKTIIRVVTARDMSFLELRYNGRSTDYPYTIVQLELDQNGKGTGSLIAAAKISFNKKKNTYEIESYQHGTAYNRIANVRRMD
jgi:hypothetical protein